jgi:beta-glucosidase
MRVETLLWSMAAFAGCVCIAGTVALSAERKDDGSVSPQPPLKQTGSPSMAQATKITAPASEPGRPIPRIEVPEWWQQRYEGMNARVRQGNVDLVFIGDSITQRWEHDGKAVWENHWSKRNAVNLGIDGDRTQQVLWRLERGNIDGISPKLAVLLIGTNNILGASVDEIADAIGRIVAMLQAKLPSTKLLLLGILPRTGTNGETEDDVRQAIIEVNRKISTLADGKNVFFLDIGRKFLCAEGTLRREAFVPDAVHLSTQGYQIMADAIEPLIANIVDGTETRNTEP